MGGTPIIDKDPIKKAINVNGMDFPSPSKSEIFDNWVEMYIDPAAKNSVIFPTACITMWRAAPWTAMLVAIAPPKTIYDNWLIVEYANRAFKSFFVIAIQDVLSWTQSRQAAVL